MAGQNYYNPLLIATAPLVAGALLVGGALLFSYLAKGIGKKKLRWPRRHEFYVPGMFEQEDFPTFLCRHCPKILRPIDAYMAHGWETRAETLLGLSKLNPSLAKCSGKGPKMGLFELITGVYTTRRMVRESWEARGHIQKTPPKARIRAAQLMIEAVSE